MTQFDKIENQIVVSGNDKSKRTDRTEDRRFSLLKLQIKRADLVERL